MCGTYGTGACVNGKAICISGKFVGLNRMYDVFEKLYNSGRREDVSGKEIIAELSFYNYIPLGAENEYEEAVLKEYRIFCKEKGGEKKWKIEKEAKKRI